MGEEKIGERLVIESLLKLICGYIYIHNEEKNCASRAREGSMVEAVVPVFAAESTP